MWDRSYHVSYAHSMSQSQQHTGSDLALFAGDLVLRSEARRIVHFTVKIALNGNHLWINDTDPQADGAIVFRSDAPPPANLNQLFEPDDSWQVCRLQQDKHSEVSSWTFMTGVDGASETRLRLGRVRDILRWFALVRHSTPWLGPRQGDKRFEVDKPAVLAAFLLGNGNHLLVCPEHSKSHILTTLESDGSGDIIVKSRNDGESSATPRLIVSIGKDFEATLAVALRYVKAGLGVLSTSPDVDKEAMHGWYDGFSYCTWNGLGRELSEEKIQEALSSLLRKGLVVSNLIIDDNWQALDNTDSGDPFSYRWTDFEANKENFPHGLKHAISSIRGSHPHLRHVAVWHGVFGYWGGFSPDGSLAKCYETRQVRKQSQESYMTGSIATVVSGKDVCTMYDDFYRFLAGCGVDSVKADNGFYPDYVQDTDARRELIYSYQDAFMQAAEKHFAHRAISCMSQTPQNLFYSFLDNGKRPPYLVRNSDDFFPDAPESHTWHIFCNAHNSLLMQHLNVLPDWDMFQTAGANSYMHAAARCLSGGPIYITDVPGEHDTDLINQITALGFDGCHRILRPNIIGRASEVYNKSHSRRFLRVTAGHIRTCFLGVFNMSDRENMELVTLEAITRLKPKSSYVVTKHYDVGKKIHILSDPYDIVPVKLQPNGGHDIVAAHPIYAAGPVELAILGLVGRMTGAAVLSQVPDFVTLSSGSGVCLKLVVRAPGPLDMPSPPPLEKDFTNNTCSNLA